MSLFEARKRVSGGRIHNFQTSAGRYNESLRANDGAVVLANMVAIPAQLDEMSFLHRRTLTVPPASKLSPTYTGNLVPIEAATPLVIMLAKPASLRGDN